MASGRSGSGEKTIMSSEIPLNLPSDNRNELNIEQTPVGYPGIWIPFFLFIAVFSLLVTTSSILPLCWDEGEARWRAESIEEWFSLFPKRSLGESFSRDSIEQGWKFVVYREGHPAFYGLLAAAGQAWGRINPSADARTFFLMFYAFAVSGVFWKVRKIQPESPFAAWASVLCLLMTPRLYAHAHFSVNDSILTSCWLLTWVCFTDSPHPKSIISSILCGIFLGLTAASKFTGLMAIPCFLIAGLFYRNREMGWYLFRCMITAAIVFFIVNVPLWIDPIYGLIRFFQLNLGREQTYNISGWFFGCRYNMTYSLPWFNTLVWVGITVPVGFLLFLIFGFVQLVKNRSRVYVPVLIANAVILLIIRSLPHAPAHDNERLFISAFAFIAIIAGLGAGRIWKYRLFDLYDTIRLDKDRLRVRATGLILFFIFLGSASSMYLYTPHWLSYYNLAIGGLPGAYRAGMEPTYWWTDLDDSALDWLNKNALPGEKVQFQSISGYNLNLLISEKKLRVNYAPKAPGEYRWYVLQSRPSLYSELDLLLQQSYTPAYTGAIKVSGIGPWNLSSVPLIRIYALEKTESEKPLESEE